MSSSSVSYSAAPWRGAAAIFALWIALWSLFILGVVAPAAQLHRASASQLVTAVAKADPSAAGGR